MKKMIFLGFIFVIVQCFFFAASDLSAQGFTKKTGGQCFTMDIPDYMTKTYELNDDASLQYQNTLKDAYIVVIVDEIDQLESVGIKFLKAKDYFDNFIKSYKTDKKNFIVNKISEFNVEDYEYAQAEMTWNTEDVDFYMLVTVVHTKTCFYNILCYTTLENKDKQKDDFLKAANSLKD